MDQDRIIKERIRFFLLGVLIVIGAIFLMGAADTQLSIDNSRYQISAWGDSKAHGAFIVDSVTGKTKIVYHYEERGDGKAVVEKDNLNKPFNKIQ